MPKNKFLLLLLLILNVTNLCLSNGNVAKKDTQDKSELFQIITNYSLLLVQQMSLNKPNASLQRTAFQEISLALTQLSPAVKKTVRPYTTIIIQEAKKFSQRKNRQNLKKAEEALNDLTIVIQKLSQKESDSIAWQAQKEILKEVEVTRDIIHQARATIKMAKEHLGLGSITPEQTTKIIHDQQNLMRRAQNKLEALTQEKEEAVIENEQKTGYLNHLLTKAYEFGNKITAPLYAGYGYTEEQKEDARIAINELEMAIQTVNYAHTITMHSKSLNEKEKKNAELVHNKKIKELENEIYQQKLIIGDVMSPQRKLFWATAGTAAALGAGYYLSSSSEPSSNIRMPSFPEKADITEETLTPVIPENPETMNRANITKGTLAPVIPENLTMDRANITEGILTPFMPENLEAMDNETKLNAAIAGGALLTGATLIGGDIVSKKQEERKKLRPNQIKRSKLYDEIRDYLQSDTNSSP